MALAWSYHNKPNMQYAIIARDGRDRDALARRLAARDAHTQLGSRMRADGRALFGVALFGDDGNMNGSIYIVDFASKKELDDWLAQEPYMTGNVWQDLEIVPCCVGPAFKL